MCSAPQLRRGLRRRLRAGVIERPTPFAYIRRQAGAVPDDVPRRGGDGVARPGGNIRRVRSWCRCVPAAVGLLLLLGLTGVAVRSAGDEFNVQTDGGPRRSGKTGTQGIEGNPHCPPPVVNGITPRNWSCKTGQARPTCDEVKRQYDGLRQRQGGKRLTGYAGVVCYDPGWVPKVYTPGEDRFAVT